jgi:hypothetical protein
VKSDDGKGDGFRKEIEKDWPHQRRNNVLEMKMKMKMKRECRLRKSEAVKTNQTFSEVSTLFTPSIILIIRNAQNTIN